MDFVRTRPLESAEINITGTINALNVSRKHKVKRFIFASSIYANTEEGGFYGSSKKAAESYVERFYETFGQKYTILRFGSLYGSRSDETNGINIIINSGIKNKKLYSVYFIAAEMEFYDKYKNEAKKIISSIKIL